MVMKSNFKVLSIAALVGLTSMGVAQAETTTTQTPTLGENSAYILATPTADSKNLITLYEYGNATGITQAVDYEVKLKNTTFGTGDASKTFDVNLIDSPVTITAQYNSNATTKYENKNHDYGTKTDPSGTSSSKPYQFTGGQAYINASGTTSSIEDALFMNNNVSANLASTTSGGKYAEILGSSLYNVGELTQVKADFVGNSINGTVSNFTGYGSLYSSGGAVYNSGTIGELTGGFIGNYTSSETNYDYAYGGAIYNRGTISSITGDFISNYAFSTSYGSNGGAICNDQKTIGNITGDFIGNYTKSESGTAGGGAISNSYDSTIGNITGDFIGNYASTTGRAFAYGGAIYNRGTISSITGDFIGNYASTSFYEVYGGAIYNNDTIGNITGDFIGNYAQGNTEAKGGAILNTGGTIGDITGDFIGNYVTSISSNANGGAISNSYDSTIGDITGDFIGNYATSISSNANGGAIYNISNSRITSITGDFIGNYAKTEGGTAEGGAIWTDKDMNFIAQDGHTSVISGNYVEDKNGKRAEAIRVVTPTSGTTSIGYKPINGKSTKKYIYEQKEPVQTTFSLINNTNSKTIIDDQIVGTSAEYAEGTFYEIYNSTTQEYDKQYVELNADGTYHHIETPEVKLYVPKLNITGDGTGLVQLNNDVINMDVSLSNSTLHLGLRDNVLDNNNITLNSGTLSMINNQVGMASLNSLTVTGDTNLAVDVDLENSQMDRLTADSYGTHNGYLNVVGMNMLSDSTNDVTEILFAQQGLKDNVTFGAGDLPHNNYQTTFYTPIYKYNVAYDNREDAGYFMFAKGDKIFVPTPESGTTGGSTGGGITVTPSGNASDAFNPAVLGGSTSASVGAVGTMSQTMNNAFGNVDTFMDIPYLERVAIKNRNKYAVSITGDATDMGRFSPLYQPKDEESDIWVKPYASFENVPLKNGPKVSNITYGTLVGFDSELHSLRRGWDRVWTGYIGYNGASQRYAGVDSTQNGGLLGGTMTLYKGNFFNATTVSVGANVANNQTMYGTDNFAMLISGVGNKTGYNFEFKEGKVILQPSMLMSYTFVNTFDYTNAAGVRIDNKPLHALQLAPGVKVIGNLKDGWQPYASVSMVWNLMGESDATANGVKLPEMSIKPYVQYGVGVQKRVKDHFMAYGQAMLQNGGRNGISLTAGMRWAIGHDNCKYDQKVEKKNNKKCHYEEQSDVVISSTGKKILKQMSATQKAMHGGKYLNTTRTAKTGVLR